MSEEPRATIQFTANVPRWVWGALAFALVSIGIGALLIGDAIQTLARTR